MLKYLYISRKQAAAVLYQAVTNLKPGNFRELKKKVNKIRPVVAKIYAK